MSQMFQETCMTQALESYIPKGETLLAGIHAVAKETEVIGVFGACHFLKDRLIPAECKNTVILRKKKRAAYDIYFGVTQSCFVIAACEPCHYAYQVHESPDAPDVNGAKVQEVTSELLFDEIGTCFSLADIQSCDIKNGWVGSVKCSITLKNGSYFKLMFPKLGGDRKRDAPSCGISRRYPCALAPTPGIGFADTLGLGSSPQRPGPTKQIPSRAAGFRTETSCSFSPRK